MGGLCFRRRLACRCLAVLHITLYCLSVPNIFFEDYRIIFLVMRHQLANLPPDLVDVGLKTQANGMQENSAWNLAETAEPGVKSLRGNHDL